MPKDRVAFWDFDDPAIPDTERDTAATAVASSGLLKLAEAAKDKTARAKYRAAAEATITALVTHYLTPTSPADKRAPGILTESCFNKRPDARPHDAANRCEFIFADYYLLECRQFPTPARFVPFPWPRYDAPCVGCYRLAMPQVG